MLKKERKEKCRMQRNNMTILKNWKNSQFKMVWPTNNQKSKYLFIQYEKEQYL